MASRSRPLPVLRGGTGYAVHTAASHLTSDALDLACSIAAVPAPTNNESLRTEFVAAQMERVGLGDIEIDEIGDVVGRIRGSGSGPPLLIAAHIDTVFGFDTDLTITREAGRVHGPGIGDNSLGVAAALMLPRILQEANLVPSVDWLITGNVGEEGLGNLRGVQHVLDAHPEVGAVIAVEGHNLGRVTNVAVGSRRYRVTVTGPGGHSWGDFGRPNAIQGAAEIIAELDRISLPESPKTTMNVGTIDGGISVNTIAPNADFLLDLRSIDSEALETLSQQVERTLDAERSGLDVHYELLGVRPAGRVSADSDLVRLACTILESQGVEPVSDASSTDANIPISRGIPSICIGLTSGGNVHREDEYIDIEPVSTGIYQLAAIALSMSDLLARDMASVSAKRFPG